MSDDLEWEEWQPHKMSFMSHMVCGSVAGLAEHVSLFPIDTIKTHIQCVRCGDVSPLQTWNYASRIIHKEGVMRLWRGVSAMFAGCVPAHAMYFSVYEATKSLVGADQEGHHPFKAAFSGAAAAFSHDLFMTPFDVIKQRMQLGYYQSFHHCLRQMIRSEGIMSLYVSLPTTLMMNIPYGCIVVPVNESALKLLNPSQKYNFGASMLAGSIAGAAAAALTNPLDVIKTRLQTQNLQPSIEKNSNFSNNSKDVVTRNSVRTFSTIFRPTPAATSLDKTFMEDCPIKGDRNFICPRGSVISKVTIEYYEGMIPVARRIIAEDGFRGFLRGIIPRILVQSPSVAISWTAYEAMKSAFKSNGML